MTRRQSLRREGAGVLQAVVLGLVLAFYVGLGAAVSTSSAPIDFLKFYASARAVISGDSIYSPSSRTDLGLSLADRAASLGRPRRNLNPPLLAVLLAPVALLGTSAGYIVWTAVSVLSGFLACAVLWRGLRADDQSDSELVVLWIALFAYFPTCTTLVMGQVSLLTMFLLACAWYLARCGYDRSAGVIVGLAVSLKVFVALVVICFALQRRWRVVAWSIGTILILALATLPIVGVKAYVEYFAVIQTVTWFSSSYNASYASVITRVLGGSENVPLLNLPGFAHGLVLLVSAATVLWLAWVTWPRPGVGSSLERFDLSYGLTLVVMLLVSPLGWVYYFPLLIIPGYAVWSVTRRGRMRAVRWGLLVAWGLSSIPTPDLEAAELNDPSRWLTTNSVYFYALFVLAIVVSCCLVSLKSASTPAGKP